MLPARLPDSRPARVQAGAGRASAGRRRACPHTHPSLSGGCLQEEGPGTVDETHNPFLGEESDPLLKKREEMMQVRGRWRELLVRQAPDGGDRNDRRAGALTC